MTAPTSPTDKITMPINEITSPITGPLTMPSTSAADRPSDEPTTHALATAPTRSTANRVTALAATLALLAGVLIFALALPARAATIGGGNASGGSGVGTPQNSSVANHPTGNSGELVFAGLCVAGIVATAGGVLWYTVRTRRTLD